MLQMRHNLVTLLYTIKGFIEAHLCRSEEGRFRDRDEELSHARESMRKIYKQTERALGITQKIGLAMKQSRNTDRDREEISIRDVWNEVSQSLRTRRSQGAGIEFIDHIPEAFPKILCDRNDFMEILYCLARNAVQAISSASRTGLPFGRQGGEPMSPAGKLIIRATLALRPGDDPAANIMIADTGPGIPEETMPHLFEPFVTTKCRERGNGLGLCIVRGLVRKNSGSISVSSFKGCGTTFVMTFPAVKSRENMGVLPLVR